MQMQNPSGQSSDDFWYILVPGIEAQEPTHQLEAMLVAGHTILCRYQEEQALWKLRVDNGEEEYQTSDAEEWIHRLRIWCEASRKWIALAKKAEARTDAMNQALQRLKNDLADMEPRLRLDVDEVSAWIEELNAKASSIEELIAVSSFHDSANND